MAKVIIDQDLTKFIKPDMIRLYISSIYEHAENLDLRPDHAVEIRKLGQINFDDGTNRLADESLTCLIQPQLVDMMENSGWAHRLGEWAVGRAERSAIAGVGTFLSPAILNDRRATDASVEYLTTVCVDLDTGDTDAKLQALISRIGHPTFTVRSGGITDEGKRKLHVHYRLDEPCDEPWKVAYIREQLAVAVGGDLSFKRIPQIIRIPGTLYDKGGKFCTVEILEHVERDISISYLEDVLDIDWKNLNPSSLWNVKEHDLSGRSVEERHDRIKKIASEEIHAGSTNDDTRFSRFTEYAGYNIRQARIGRFTVDEALDDLQTWVATKMVPPWAPDRVVAEFRNLLGRDQMAHPDTWMERRKPIAQNLPRMTPSATLPDLKDNPSEAAVPAQYAPAEGQPAVATTNAPAAPQMQSWSIEDFDVGTLYQGEAPPERFLVENFISWNNVHAMVADGGVGKTYLGIELALRMAAGTELPENNFLGFEVKEKCVSIVLTVEDGKDDIHRRLVAIDPDGDLRAAAKGSCFIVPVKEQILGGLMLVEKDARGNHKSSAGWHFVLEKIGNIIKTHPGIPAFVIIDTYSATHHGDENSTVGTVEWFRAAGLLSAYYQASIMVMHHVRKSDPEKEVKTPSEFRQAIRGSIAFPASCRTVIGIWEMPNSDSVLKELPKEQGARLFNMGIVKQNGGADWSDRSDPRYPEPMITLRRLGNGKLIYDALIHDKRITLTTEKKERQHSQLVQVKAAVLYACRWYSENAWALTETLMTKKNETIFPAEIQEVKPAVIKKAITELVKAKTLREVKIKGRGGSFTVYDWAEGDYTLGKQMDRAKETPVLDWRGIRYDDQMQEYVEAKTVPDFMSYGNPRG